MALGFRPCTGWFILAAVSAIFNNQCAMLALPDVATARLGLSIRHPPWGSRKTAPEENDIHTLVSVARLEIARSSDLAIPWTPPRDNPPFQVPNNQVGDLLIGIWPFGFPVGLRLVWRVPRLQGAHGDSFR